MIDHVMPSLELARLPGVNSMSPVIFVVASLPAGRPTP